MQEPAREDPRTLRSRALLIQALTDLLTEIPFDKIRVKDICARAGVNRSTFYAHFEDKFHLLTYGIQELMDCLMLLPSEDAAQFQHAIYRIFKFFKLNQQEYTLLLLNHRNGAARQILQEEFSRSLCRALRRRLPQVPPAELTDGALFFTGGLFAMLSRWLADGAIIPPGEMARRFVGMLPPAFTSLPSNGDSPAC